MSSPLAAALFAAVTLTKSGSLISDPVNGALTPKAIPDSVVEYVVTVRNTAGVPLDGGALVVTDALPPATRLFVGDLGGAGTGPVAASQGLPVSGLSTVFTSLASTTDDLQFSSDGGASFTYTPTPDASGYDARVTTLRIKTRGSAFIGGVYRLRYRVAVR